MLSSYYSLLKLKTSANHSHRHQHVCGNIADKYSLSKYFQSGVLGSTD